MVLGGFYVDGSGYPKFSAPPSGETMRQIIKIFGGARTCSRSSITISSLVGLGFHPPPGWPKTLSFFCLFVCLSVCSSRFWTSELCARFRHEGIGVQKRFWCRWTGEHSGKFCSRRAAANTRLQLSVDDTLYLTFKELTGVINPVNDSSL